MSTDKPRYYSTPSVTVDADVSLSEFDLEDIVGYLRHKGYHVTGGPVHDQDGVDGDEIHPSDLDHVFTLAVAGQIEAARQEALHLVGNAIGRTLQ